MRNRWLYGVAMFFPLFWSACATTHMQSVEPTPGFDATRIHHVLVVSIAKTPEIRVFVEEEFVKQWKERGVDAVASGSVLPANVTLDKAGVEPFVKAHGFDTVLVTRLMSRKAIDQEVHVHQAGEAPENENMNDYFQAVVASPGDPVSYEMAILTTTVFDAATEKKVWSGVSETLITGDVPKLIRPFTKTILKNLYATR